MSINVKNVRTTNSTIASTEAGKKLGAMLREERSLMDVGLGILGAVHYSRAVSVLESINRNEGGATAALWYTLRKIIDKMSAMTSFDLAQIVPGYIVHIISQEGFDMARCAKSPSGRKALEIIVSFANSFAGNGWPSVEGDPITIESLLPKQTKAEKAKTYLSNLPPMYMGCERAIYGMIRNAVNRISNMPEDQSEALTSTDIDHMVRDFGYSEYRCNYDPKLLKIMQGFITLFD